MLHIAIYNKNIKIEAKSFGVCNFFVTLQPKHIKY
jgi:hypothetical protein